MYLHAGRNRVIRSRTIIGIFDMDRATESRTTQEFLRRMEKDGLMESASYELPKSFILYDDELAPGVQKVCCSQISPAALCGRAEPFPVGDKSDK